MGGRSLDPDKILDRGVFVNQLVNAGFSREQANIVLDEADRLDLDPAHVGQFQKHFVTESGEVDLGKLDVFMHIHATKMTLQTYLPVLQSRADNVDNHTAIDDLQDSIALMHVSGMSGTEIADFMNKYVKISKSFTPHPTEGLSRNGIKLARNLVEASETDRRGRTFALKNAMRAISQSTDFEASKRANMLDETEYSNECARVHNSGVNQLDREVERIIFEVTGEHHNIRMNTAARSWDLDADGKNNAEGFSMIAKMSYSTLGAFQDLAQNLDFAVENTKSQEHRDKITAMRADVQSVMDNLAPVYDRARDITVALANVDPEKREALYRHHYENDFESLKGKFAGIYDSLGDKKRGYETFQKTVSDLDYLRKAIEADGNSDGALALDESFRTISRCGFALEKLQTRHNDLVYIDMLDNMVGSDMFWATGILSHNEKQEVLQAGKFSNLSNDQQFDYMQKILTYAEKNGNRAELVELVRASNVLSFKPLDKGGNGYPNQERPYADRLELRQMYPRLFAEGIISDAQKIASSRQKFFADLFGMTDMEHMALNEDRKNLARTLTQHYNTMGGAENMKNRAERMPAYFRRGHETLHVMRPASDAERNGGSMTRIQAIDQYRKTVREAYEHKVPVEIMIGGGQSLNRFGGDVDMVRRIVAQELKEIFKEKEARGEVLDENDRRMMIMATTTMYTEQGRTRRIASTTGGQVRDDFAGKLRNIVQDYLDLQGLVPDNTFIDKKTPVSTNMERILNPPKFNSAMKWTMAGQRIENYFHFANIYRKGEDGKPTSTLVLDSFAEKTGAPHILPFLNNGARASAGKAGGASNLSSLRAIGKDQGLYLTQSFHAGFFVSGIVMEDFHTALRDGKIDLKDVRDVVKSPEWSEAIFSRNLIDAGRFNATHLFKSLSGGDVTNWTFDRAMKIGKEVAWKKDLDTNRQYLVYANQEAEGVTDEQLYLCRIYYDRAMFLAMTEAALTPEGQGISMKNSIDEIIRSIRPDDNGLNIGMGSKTRKAWPSVEDDLENHRKNAAGFAMIQLVDRDIEARLKRGQSKNEVMEIYGQGNPKAAEARFRQLGGAFRSGTLPHVSKWAGYVTYGLNNRQDVNMKAMLVQRMSEPDNAVSMGHEHS